MNSLRETRNSWIDFKQAKIEGYCPVNRYAQESNFSVCLSSWINSSCKTGFIIQDRDETVHTCHPISYTSSIFSTSPSSMMIFRAMASIFFT